LALIVEGIALEIHNTVGNIIGVTPLLSPSGIGLVGLIVGVPSSLVGKGIGVYICNVGNPTQTQKTYENDRFHSPSMFFIAIGA
jgi:hypothetical protein